MEETMNEVHRYFIKLDDPNKVERKKNLLAIQRVLTEKYPLANTPKNNNREVCVLWNEKFHVPLLKLLRDESERVREISAELILFFYGHMVNTSPMTLSYILPVLKQRLVCKEEIIIEVSEEVRFLLIKILSRILDLPNETEDLKVHLDDLIAILGSCMNDSFADIKVEACENVHKLAKTMPKDFHLTAAGLLNPLAKAMTHQQKKVRVACIKACGVVLHHSGFDDFQVIGSHLAQRLFDPIPQVRLAVSNVAGDLLMNWRCASSCCSLLIPLLLTSLEDETPSTKEAVWKLWSQIGKKWVEDEATRDDKMKEQLDFQGASEPPTHFPTEIQRPNFGCRKYITRVIYKLIPALKNDLNDWLVETRIKTSQLTYILVCHLEETCVITQHADTLLGLFFQGVKDEESIVMKNMCRAARIYGYFVPPKTWCPMVSQRLMVQASYSDLMVVAHIITGANPTLLRGDLEDLTLTLQDDTVCLTSNEVYLDSLLECIKAILSVSPEINSISSQLFKIIITVDGLSNGADLQKATQEAIEVLAKNQNITAEQLYKKELGPLLKTMKLECEEWTNNSFRVSIFTKLLIRAGSVLGHYPDLVMSIFHQVLNRENQAVEAEMKLKLFLTLSRLLLDLKNTLDSKNEFKSLALKIVTDLIIPAIKWQAGRKAEAVRIAATSSLYSVFQSGSISPKDLWSTPLSSKLIPSMNRLLEDDSIRARLFTVQTYQFVFEQGRVLIPMDYLVKICEVLMKRLDDVNDEVRMACLKTLESVLHCLPPGGANAQLEHYMQGVYSKLLLHMDDSNEQIRNAALETLRITGQKCPQVLQNLTKKCLEKHVHKDQCNQLLEHLNNLSL